ncbi:MAG: hypothetical protein JRH19_18035 [Deltaproteobacteria bacterium]|nr:hypothetical protein [Deltaproteobacteria bacterium]
MEDTLDLRCGELVEVRSEAEILATLDEKGDLEGLPFMPEMSSFSGRQLRVHRRSDKTCDTITGDYRGRRMQRTVHLAEARCDGGGHGGCQAACMFFWKEAWLKRVEPKPTAPLWSLVADSTPSDSASRVAAGACNAEGLRANSVQEGSPDDPDPAFRCQATQLLRASSPLNWRAPGPYLRDWLSGNVGFVFLARALVFRGLYQLVRLGKGYRIKKNLYQMLARLAGEVPWPYDRGILTGRTPKESLDLVPGERVRVKPQEEILATLNGMSNRGLSFAPEMVRYCGQEHRVLARVDKIVNEKTGHLVKLPNDCIILENVICQSECSSYRLFCPRSIYPYWREIWLQRIDDVG